MTPRQLLHSLSLADPSLRASCAAVYGSSPELLDHACSRLWILARHYADTFNYDDHVVVVRAPGRVNLIGEHTDYNGLPVLPMAIPRDVIVMASRSDDDLVHVSNVDPAFPPRQFKIEPLIPPFPPGDWGNYVKSAVQGLINHWQTTQGISGLRMAISGNVPVASGLSSSAAFTIACALAVLTVHQRSIPPLLFAELMAHSDHYVGMASGGMDQATSILARAGACLKIDFFPLRVQPVSLPPDTTVVVCQSRVKAAKAANAREEYNRRVVECRLATALLHAASPRSDRVPLRLSEWLAWDCDGLDDALARINATLHPEPYRLPELSRLLHQNPETILSTLCATPAGTPCHEPPDGFHLLKRARHVISETRRVEDAFSILSSTPPDAARRFGELMNQSHVSCRDDYHISCPELEDLVTAARDAGAYGARLTGAGFGGCTVNLVPSPLVPHFVDALNRSYYVPRQLDHLPDNIFVFQPAPGAGVLLS
ncbi:MAG: galactokinase [bacterium]|nr:galactokinase [bacterium]